MSAANPGTPNKAFQDRLGRVAEKHAPIAAARPQVDVLPDWRENIRTPKGFAIAIALGLVAVVIVRLVRYHAFGGSLIGDNADLTMAIDLVAGGLLSFAVFQVTSYRGFPFYLAQMAGVVAMLVAMQNMVHSVPGAFELAFSPEWTEDVIASTEPGTLLVRGHSMHMTAPQEDIAEADIAPEAAPEKVLPTVRRMN